MFSEEMATLFCNLSMLQLYCLLSRLERNARRMARQIDIECDEDSDDGRGGGGGGQGMFVVSTQPITYVLGIG
jgi:hypothetical protein